MIGILLLGLKLFVLKDQIVFYIGASTDFNSVIFVVLAMGLYVCAEWILSFVQEIAGVCTEPQGSRSTMYILFLSFLVCEAEANPV